MSQNFEKLFPVTKFDPDMKPQPLPWLVKGLWQKGKINGIAGYEKSGKSRVLGWLLVGMHLTSCLGLDVIPNYPPKILYLCGEETKEVVNQRLKTYAEFQGVDLNKFNIFFMDATGMKLEQKVQRDWLIQFILDNGFEVIVADPLRRLHSANEDKSTEMAPIYNDIRRWTNHHGITILLVHHTGKVNDEVDMTRIANWFRGSTDLAAILDCAMYVQRLTKTTIAIHRQGRFEPLPNLTLQDQSDGAGFKRMN